MISFKQHHFKKEMLLMLVLWYVAGALSYRDIEELASEGLLGQSLSGELIKIQSDQEL